MAKVRAFSSVLLVLALLAFSGAANSVGAQTSHLKLGIPLDTSSPSEWGRVIQAAPVVGMVILNPENGPGESPNPGLVSDAAQAQQAGIRVIGYVFTRYADGSVNVSQAEHEVDEYLSWYKVDGVFFDQANSSCAPTPEAYYAALHQYVKTKSPGLMVVLNPGATPGSCYGWMSDVLIDFEDTFANYQANYHGAGWTNEYPAESFFHLILGAPNESAMEASVNSAVARNAGWVYVTSFDTSQNNTYGSLPPYFDQEVAYVASINGEVDPLSPRLPVLPLGVVVAVAAGVSLVVFRKKMKAIARKVSRQALRNVGQTYAGPATTMTLPVIHGW